MSSGGSASRGSVLYNRARKKLQRYAARASKAADRLDRDPELVSGLDDVFRLALTLDTDAKRSAFFDEHDITPDPITQNWIQPIVKSLIPNAHTSVTANRCKWAGAVAEAVATPTPANGFRAFLKRKGGLRKAYEAYSERNKSAERKAQEWAEKEALMRRYLGGDFEGVSVAIVKGDKIVRHVDMGPPDAVNTFILTHARAAEAQDAKPLTSEQMAAA